MESTERTKKSDSYMNPKRAALQPQRKEIDKLVGIVRAKRNQINENKKLYKESKDIKIKKAIEKDLSFLMEKKQELKVKREDYYSKLHAPIRTAKKSVSKEDLGNYVLTFVGITKTVYDKILKRVKACVPIDYKVVIES